MGAKRTDVAGWNNRFDDKRYGGIHGARGANIFPYETDAVSTATDPDAIYDGETVVPLGSIVSEVQINVTEAFGFEGEGPATIIVGTTGDDDVLVTLADGVDLSTTGIKRVNRETKWPAGSVVRTTIGGQTTSGSAIVTVDYSV